MHTPIVLDCAHFSAYSPFYSHSRTPNHEILEIHRIVIWVLSLEAQDMPIFLVGSKAFIQIVIIHTFYIYILQNLYLHVHHT